MSKPSKKVSPVVRSPNEAVLSSNIPRVMLNHLKGRSKLHDGAPVSTLVRWAIEFQVNRNWEPIPKACLSASDEKQLKEWLASGADIDELIPGKL